MTGRLDTLQAAVLLAKLEVFEQELEARQEVAGRYLRLLAGCNGLELPRVPEGSRSAWAVFSILAKDSRHRERIRARLGQAGVPTMVYYPRPLHLQPVFAHLGYAPGDFPVSEDVAERILSLPMHPYLGLDLQERAAGVIWRAL